MQPKMIRKGAALIAGVSGDGTKTGEVWADLETRYAAAPFPKVDESGYEVRFWESRMTQKAPDPAKSVHIGFLAEAAPEGFSTVTLPAAEYAVFDVLAANGYDSGNEKMEHWLSESGYRLLEFDGFEYVVERYDEKKFKGGDQPDSVVEIWLPVERKGE
jgi:hypothetical protein